MLLDFAKPIVQAPMAGGPSNPQLCLAVAKAGGLGFLASGYLSSAQLAEQIAEVEKHTQKPYGVNLFVPATPAAGKDLEYLAYREALQSYFGAAVDLPEEMQWSDDSYEKKLEIVLDSRAKYVSFTFGFPSNTLIQQLQAAGKKVVLNATTPEEVVHALELGADILWVKRQKVLQMALKSPPLQSGGCKTTPHTARS